MLHVDSRDATPLRLAWLGFGFGFAGYLLRINEIFNSCEIHAEHFKWHQRALSAMLNPPFVRFSLSLYLDT